MAVRTVHTTKAPGQAGPYSQATVAGGFVFAAGQTGRAPGTDRLAGDDVERQTEQALANLAAVLQSAGCEWRDVVKVNVYLVDMGEFARMNEVYARTLGGVRPARTTIAAVGLPGGARVEIDAVAKLPE